MVDVPISSLPPMVTPLGGGVQFVGNQFGTTGITTTADISSYIGQSLMPLIYGGSANKLPIQTSAGTLIDSGIDINDNVALTQNLWTAYKTSTAISGALAGYIPAVSGAGTGNLPQFNGGGILVDSGKSVNDTITTAANLWSALQTQTAITTGLLNTPTLGAIQVASTANVPTLSGLLTIDGYTLVNNDLVLLKNQTNGDNGVWRAASGAWVRQRANGAGYSNVTTETTYSQLGIQGGVINVLNGTVGKNLQYQISIVNPAATFGNTTVTVTATTKMPALNPQNIYADSTAGNDTNFNGTQSFPFATLSKAFSSITTTPLTINLMGNSAYSSAVTWTQTNTTVQGNNLTNNGGQQTISGQQTFASGSRYNHFTNTYHSTGSTAPFSFASGALCSNELKNISVVSTAADWLGLNAGCRNWIRLNNITFGTPGINTINLPAFTNAFTIYVDKQDTFCGPIIFTGTGAANTIIVVGPGIAESNVRVSTGFLGTILNQQPFTSRLGSFQRSVGVITNQTDLTTVLSHTASIGYDGYYAISGFNPTSFSRGAIIGKQTLAGVGTSVFYVRQFAFAPGSVQDLANTLYTPSATGSDWPVFTGGTTLATVAQYARYVSPDGTAQTLSANYPIKFPTQETKIGTAVSVNTAGDQITLATGYTYRLRGAAGVIYSNGVIPVSLFVAQWYNGTSGLYVGSTSATTASSSGNFDAFYSGTAEYTITPTTTTVMQLRVPFSSGVVGIGYDAVNNINQQPWFEVEAIASPAVIPTAQATAPTITVLKSGSGTYTVPAGVSYLKARAIAGGGGGSGGGAQSGYDPTVGNGTAGGNTTFGGLTLLGGSKNYVPSSTSVTLPSGFAGNGISGAGGLFGGRASGAAPANGNNGASTPFGSGGGAGTPDYGAQSPAANTGAGGGGGGTAANGGANGGYGGGSGDYADFVIAAPAATYAYSIGTGGAGGAALSSGNGGAAGSAGIIIIEEYR